MNAPSVLPISDRIATAWSAETTGRLLRLLADQMESHFQSVMHSRERVLNWNTPADNIARASSLLHAGESSSMRVVETPSTATAVIDQRFRELVDETLQRGHNLHDPRYIGHQVPASSPVAALFDAVGSLTNQAMAIYEMGPWASAVERLLVDELGCRFGLQPGTFSGLMTSGGSLANLTALLTARNVVLEGAWERGVGSEFDKGSPRHDNARPVVLVHADAHYSLTRAAGVLGIGTRQVLRIPLDSRRRIDPEALDNMLTELAGQQQPVLAVCACACSTPTGAFDPLHAIADVCERHHVWLHVDAAHGGAVIFSEQHRHRVAGIERADSFVCDAHKMLFVPALCAFVFYRNREHRYVAFQQEAPYLFDPSQPGASSDFDCGLMTFECTKRAAVLSLWGLWSLFGVELFRDLVDRVCELARHLYEQLQTSFDFVPLHCPECNIVCFRYVPEEVSTMTVEEQGEFNREVRRDLMLTGEFYIVQTTLDGAGALRVVVMNPLTTESHLDALLDAIRAAGKRVLCQH